MGLGWAGTRRGQSLVEYSLLLALLCLGVMAPLAALKTTIGRQFAAQRDSLTGPADGQPAAAPPESAADGPQETSPTAQTPAEPAEDRGASPGDPAPPAAATLGPALGGGGAAGDADNGEPAGQGGQQDDEGDAKDKDKDKDKDKGKNGNNGNHYGQIKNGTYEP